MDAQMIVATHETAAAASRGAGASGSIVFDRVSITFGGSLLVVDGVSLHVAAGEFVSIVGPSGCGKTTLLNLAAGLLPPDVAKGAVTVGGKPPLRGSRDIAYMLARDALSPWRTALGNAELGAEIRGVPAKERRDRARGLLEAVGLKGFEEAYPKALSQGMRQRVALARTLVTDPDVVLLDEPFSALDSQTRLALADEVADILRREGKTIILVTHDIGEAVSMAERVVVLSRRPGRIRSTHTIRFGAAGAARPAPLTARNAPEFNGYFRALWEELEVHVEG
jgi:NitT/TauT family transport system ATP-binding protein